MSSVLPRSTLQRDAVARCPSEDVRKTKLLETTTLASVGRVCTSNSEGARSGACVVLQDCRPQNRVISLQSSYASVVNDCNLAPAFCPTCGEQLPRRLHHTVITVSLGSSYLLPLTAHTYIEVRSMRLYVCDPASMGQRAARPAGLQFAKILLRVYRWSKLANGGMKRGPKWPQRARW